MEFQTPILSIEDIAALEEKYNQELMSGKGVDKQTKFNYAFALVQSEYRQDLQRGIDLLEGILSPHKIRLTRRSISASAQLITMSCLQIYSKPSLATVITRTTTRWGCTAASSMPMHGPQLRHFFGQSQAIARP
jgi:hypothetical protein